ncbi:putative polysaccharide biosynthesis protein [Sporosarcina gallistercoris]|uniref:Polysaccharide biosynthesis protein n=1 Tax=Sporosarcina gallistercoris TaxID=2762245 RepID=A0ABR8PMV4_9BACL|nr:polysaccharide biosynthesis protein [Sporosarcina gallistercoris]MBD7909514.1 polysaccharide biosynthesis protein [Sporosarcina gallistercoris]
MAASEWTMKTFMKGASILTISALIVKLLGAVYRVPFQNLVGDKGFYIYQQVYPFIGIFIIWTTYGAAVAISKLLASTQLPEERRAILKLSFVYLGVLSIIAFVALFSGASLIASLMGDPELAPLLRTGAYVLLVMPFLAVFKGTFQSRGEMVPIAVSGVGEQGIRVAIILIGTWAAVQSGASLYETGTIAVWGAVIGQTAGVVLLALWSRNSLNAPAIGFSIDKRRVIKELTLVSLSVSASSLILLLYQMADAFTILNLLMSSGVHEEVAMTGKGIYDRGQPLVQLGSLIATTLAMAIVPLISYHTTVSGGRSAWPFVRLTFRVAILFGWAAAVGLAALLPQVNVLLFETSEESFALAVFCVQIFWLSLVLPLCAILQGAGSGKIPALLLLVGLAVKILANVLLVPVYGVTGAALAGNIGFAVTAAGLLVYFKRMWPVRLAPGRFYGWILLATIAMIVVVELWLWIISTFTQGGNSRSVAALSAFPAVMLGASVFLIIVMKSRILAEKDWYLLPFGKRFARVQLLLTKKRR